MFREKGDGLRARLSVWRGMKIKNDYKAKLKIWAVEAKVVSLPKAVGFPTFSCRRFSSGDEMNVWKKNMLAEIARRGGLRWTK